MSLYVTVQFKDRDMNWRGRTYDFELAASASAPKQGDIIRMYSEDGTQKVCNATRVRVVDIKPTSLTAQKQKITYVPSSLEEPSIAKL